MARNVQNGINCSNGETENVVIANNTVQNWTKQAIEVQTGNVNPVVNVTIKGNVLVNGDNQAIQVNNNAHANIAGNFIRDCPKSGNTKDPIQIFDGKYPCHIIGNHIVDTNGEAPMGGNDVSNKPHKQIVSFNTGRNTSKTWAPGQPDRLVMGNSFDSDHFASDECIMIANDYNKEYSQGKGVKIGNSVSIFSNESKSTFIHHDPNTGHITENAGSVTKSGDGSKTVFAVSHGLSARPEAHNVWPESADAAGGFYVSNVDASKIELTYKSAPPSGTDNLTWGFSARLKA